MMWGSILFWPFAAGMFVVGLILGLALLAFIIWMIIDCIQRKFKNDAEKIIWIVLIVLTTWIGSLVYYFVIKISNPKGISKQ